MQNTNNLKVSPHYIGIPQYLLDTNYDLSVLFRGQDENLDMGDPRRYGLYHPHKLGYRATLVGDGYCMVRRLNLSPLQSNPARSEPLADQLEAKYSTCEMLDFWSSGVETGWSTLSGGEIFTTKKDGTRYGFVNWDQVGTYLYLPSVVSRVIPLTNDDYAGYITRFTRDEYERCLLDYRGLFVVELMEKPKNPCFIKRKRQIVFT